MALRKVCSLLGTAAATVALLGGLSACSATGVTSGRLDAAVGPTFARLYVVQQQQLGKDVPHRPDGVAQCARGNTASPHRGAGDDWVCTVRYPFPDGHVQPINYDLKVAPDGCYTADGPAPVVGQQHQTDSNGKDVTNPLFEFDGCFDVT